VGLGKTHLINSIGNQILDNDPSANICYTTSEKFTNELINCLRYEKMTDFRNKYRNKDVLLLDDIQFLGAKREPRRNFSIPSTPSTNLTPDHNHQRQAPKEIPGLEERLRSRISWGLIADIQPPDIETKVAILCKKAELFNISLSNEVGLFLASHLGTNVRELEGALTRLRAYSSLTGSEITAAMAKETLKDIFSDRQKMISIDNIQKNVASFYNISLSDMKSSKKTEDLCSSPTDCHVSLPNHDQILLPGNRGKIRGKDHSTVIYAVRQIEKRLNEDRDLKNTSRL